MAAKIYYDKDADLSLLKDKTIAILGYGSQGHAHAQNLRDSGCNVIVAELAGTPNWELAVKDGFQPMAAPEAVAKADIITMLAPDELQADIFIDFTLSSSSTVISETFVYSLERRLDTRQEAF